MIRINKKIMLLIAIIIYLRDAAGNYTVYLTEQDYNNIGAFYAWDVTGEF